MDEIRHYLISVTACAIICGIVTGLSGKNSAHGTIIKLISGLFLALTVISAWVKVQLIDFSDYMDSFSCEASVWAADGESIAYGELSAIIKEQTEAYILDKAISMGLNIEVEVTLDSSNPPIPSAVSINGSISPFSKEKLSRYIADDLGIPEESQLWI